MLLDALFELAPAGLALLDGARRLTRCNRALLQMVGAEPGSLNGLVVDELFHPEDRPQLAAQQASLLDRTTGHDELKARLLKRDGLTLWTRVTSSRTPEGLSFVVEDRSVVRAAREAQEQLAFELGERVKELTALHATTRIISQTQLSVDEVLSAVVKLLPPAFQFPAQASARLSLGARSWVTEGHHESGVILRSGFTSSTGQKGELAVCYHDPPLREGQPPFLPEEQPLLDSIAENLRVELNRRHAVAEARRQQDWIDHALGVARMGVWEWDLVRDELTISEHLANFIGLSGVQRGPVSAFNHVVHPEDQALTSSRLRSLVATPGAQGRLVMDFRVARPEGGWRNLSAVLQLVCAKDGRPLRVVAILADVSSQRALEGHLRQAQKLEAMARAAGTVARDFDAVLATVRSVTDRLGQLVAPGDPSREIVDEIAQAAERGVTLTRQLLAFGSQGPSSPATLDLSGLIAELLPMLRRLAGAVEVRAELAPECFVRGDPGQLEQVVLNLVVNARDATTPPGRVTLSTRRVDREGPAVELVVADEGTGMSPQTRARLFEPFFTTKEAGKGTGLGLSVVFGVVQRSGGHIAVDSELGRGTTFRVELPRVEAGR